MKYLKKLMICLGLISIMWGCDEDNLGPIPPSGNMVLNVSDLEVLPDGWTYEGWIVVDGTPFSTGKFLVDEGGTVSNKTIPVESAQLEAASDFIISIESTTDNDPAPSNVKVLAGTFGQYEADLSHASSNAIGVDLEDGDNYSGKFLIAAPTSATADDDTSGVWFIDNSSGSAAAGLTIPTLNTGWVYEGWTIIDGIPVSTGRFTSANGADQSCTYCGVLAAPPFPGEDFLQNAPAGLSFPTNLSGSTTVISVEPEPDYSDAPYSIKILSGDVPGESTIQLNTPYDMSDGAVTAPSGKVLRFFGFDCNNDGCL